MPSGSYTRRDSYGNTRRDSYGNTSHHSYSSSSGPGYADRYEGSASYGRRAPGAAPSVFQYQVDDFGGPRSASSRVSSSRANSSARPDPFDYLEPDRYGDASRSTGSSRARHPHANSGVSRPSVFDYEVDDFSSSRRAPAPVRTPTSTRFNDSYQYQERGFEAPRSSASSYNDHSRAGRGGNVFDYQVPGSPPPAPRSSRSRDVPMRNDPPPRIVGWGTRDPPRRSDRNEWDDDPVPPYVRPGESPPLYSPY